MRLAPLLLLSALLHAYIGARLVPGLMGLAPWAAWVLAVLLAASVAIVPLGMAARYVVRARWVSLATWAGLLGMGLVSSLFVLTLLRDVGLLIALPFGLAGPRAAGWSAAAVPLLALATSLIGFVNARRTASLVHVDVPIANLPAALHGFTIAQISDIHVGPTIRRGYVAAIVEAVNRLQADVVAVTGDLVDGSVRELSAHVAPLAGLRARHGSFFVTGNHEYYSGAPAWVAELRRLGLTVLMNQHVVLEQDGAHLLLAGVTDHGAHHFDEAQRSDPHAALAGAPATAGVRVLLAHQPRSAAAAAEAGFHLQLSGHTHGGQFLPWPLFVKLQQPFVAGLHKWQGLWVYVSRGTGYWGPPKRFGAPSEITRLRLIPAV